MTIFDYIIAIIVVLIAVYIISRIQAAAWLHTIEKFFKNQKNKQNEQEKK